MKELFTRLLLAEAAVGVVALVLVECFPRQLIALFGAANESVYYTDFAVKSFRIYLDVYKRQPYRNIILYDQNGRLIHECSPRFAAMQRKRHCHLECCHAGSRCV